MSPNPWLRRDFDGACVLVTGGTRGLGLAIGLALAREGAHVWLTHRWGSVAEGELRDAFSRAGAKPPRVVEADILHEGDTDHLLEQMAEQHDAVDVFVSNVALCPTGPLTETWNRRRAHRGIGATAWPLIGIAQRIHARFGGWPRAILATTTDSDASLFPGYGYVALSKALLVTLARYLAHHLWEEGVRVNILQCRPVATESLTATFGEEFAPFLERWGGPDAVGDVEEIGQAALALCSGLLDAMTGQVLTVDRGFAYRNNLNTLYSRRADLGLE